MANDEFYDGGRSQESDIELDDGMALQEWRHERLARPEYQAPAQNRQQLEQHVPWAMAMCVDRRGSAQEARS